MRLLACSIFLVLAVIVRPAHADELADRAVIRDAVTQAWQAGDYDTLERLHTQYSDFPHQRTASGASKMGLFIDGLTEGREATDEVLQRDIARTQRWVQAHPGSPIGYVLHAQALVAYGWHQRGSGFAKTVSPQAWAALHEYEQRASNYLLEHKGVASQTTSWHATMINIGRDEGWSPEVMKRLFEEGVAKAPTDYRLYQNMAYVLFPKWRGSIDQLDAFIREVSAHAPSVYGKELYARLYSAAGEDQFKRDLYSDSRIEWATMQDGLQAWVKHFPTAWNKNIFAYQACLAGDKAVAKPLFDEIAGRPELEIWSPEAEATFEDCARWVADARAHPVSPPLGDHVVRHVAAH